MRALLHRFVDERLVVVVILINAVALFYGDYRSETAPDSFWFAVDYGCVVYFLAETAIKLGFGPREYFGNNWNRLDFAIVVASTPVLLSPWVDLYWLSSLTALRLLRLFRLFRLFRFVPGRDEMAAGIARSLRASVGVMLGVILVNIILALGAVVLFGGSPEDPYFGTPWRAVYTMFQVFTVEGWYEIPAAVASARDDWVWAGFVRAYFAMAVFGGGILGLSLVNAVFVDQMTADNNEPLRQRLDTLTTELAALRAEMRALRQDLAAGAVTVARREDAGPGPEPEAEPEG